MPTATYNQIATYTVPTNTPSYTFSSISQAYTDLIVDVLLPPYSTNFDIQIGASNTIDTSGNYSTTRNFQYGTSPSINVDAQSDNATGLLGNVSNSTTTNQPTYIHMQIMNYSSAAMNKTVLTEFGALESSGAQAVIAGLWRSNSAVNCLRIWSTNSSNIPAGTIISLYGIAAA